MNVNTLNHTSKKIIGIYHKDCIDGTTAAALLLQKFPNIQLFPLSRGYVEKDFTTILKEITNNTIVYIVDFDLSEEHLTTIATQAHHIVVIDHHIGVQEVLAKVEEIHDNFNYIFDNDRSGASLLWMYLYPDETIPDLIQLVEYDDTGKWDKDARTKFSTRYLTPLINQPETINQALKMPIEILLKRGQTVSDFADFLVDLYIKKTKPITIKIDDNYVIAYNATYNAQQLRSTIGHRLAVQHNTTIALFRINGNNVRLSFRGIDDVRPSSLDYASSLSGSGHRNSAGASVTLKKFMDMIQF